MAKLRSPFSSVVEHWSRKPGVMSSNLIGGNKFFSVFWTLNLSRAKKIYRSWQDSNLRGETPLDFKSNALTTRPQLQL